MFKTKKNVCVECFKCGLSDLFVDKVNFDEYFAVTELNNWQWYARNKVNFRFTEIDAGDRGQNKDRKGKETDRDRDSSDQYSKNRTK